MGLERVCLLLVAFLSGGVLMALEIVGSRVLAPSFGGSLFVWGSLIGVFLAALSLGYYLGGRAADRAPQAWVLSLCLALAGAYVLLIPWYGDGVLDAIAMRDMGNRTGPLVGCLALFFLPGMLMGVTSPFVIRLTARSVEQVGQTAGAVYAVSTLGSIAGTLGSAFYLIQMLGTSKVVMVLGATLVGTAALALLGRAGGARGKAAAAVVAAALLVGAAKPGWAVEKVLLERDSAYHRLFVTEQGQYRYLRADNIYHTQMDLTDPQGRGLPYADYVDIAFLMKPDIRDVLVIGLGGGTVPKRFVRDYPQVRMEAAEIDADVIKIAGRYFYVKEGPRLKVHESDGRMYLKRTKKKYDLIFLDAYYADTVPFFLTTKEFFELVRGHLTPGGVFANNVLGQESGPKSKFFRSVYRTMRETFPQVYAFRVAESPATMYNFEIFGVNSRQTIGMETIVQRAVEMGGRQIKDGALVARVANYVKSVRTNDVPTLTDDYAPVDALIHLW